MYHRGVADGQPDVLFEWDEGNIQHLAQHAIAPAEAEEVLTNEHVIHDHHVVDGEDRWRALGNTNALRILVIVFSIRLEKVRPITGWGASKKVIKEYFNRS